MKKNQPQPKEDKLVPFQVKHIVIWAHLLFELPKKYLFGGKGENKQTKKTPQTGLNHSGD